MKPLTPPRDVSHLPDFTEEDRTEIRNHVQKIVTGTAFRGSQRSAQFLHYIVEQLLAGNLDALKERIIGIQLFGRPPSYDTGEDAIVRVTASDVRKRLLQHYGQYGSVSGLRLSLPLGSYLPVIHRDGERGESGGSSEPVTAVRPVEATVNSATLLRSVLAASVTAQPPLRGNVRRRLLLGSLWMGWALALLLALLSFVPIRSAANPAMPWSTLFHSGSSIRIITSDPNIEKIERLTGQPITLSDYANQQYVPNPAALPPETVRFARDYLRGDLAATVDTDVSARIAALAQSSVTRVEVRGARDLRLAEVYTDDNFIFLGSPRSNRWTSLFNDGLDLRFALKNGQEIIENMHPRAGEQSDYVPTAGGYATGQSFATVSYLPNPGRSGRVLLLAGANAEGTAAAGELVVDSLRMLSALRACGIPSGESFQLLLQLDTMAGSSSNVKVIACHALSHVNRN